MKIQDIITLEKKKSKQTKNKYSNTYWCYENTTELNYEKKNGYYWNIPSHSENQSVLMNNWERDCVVAYLENKYLLAFVIKIRGENNFKSFVYIKDLLKSVVGSYSYTINRANNNQQIRKAFEEDKESLVIVDNIEYTKFNKMGIIESLK